MIYEFIVESLMKHFNHLPEGSSEKFYLALEDDAQVKGLHDAFVGAPNVSTFLFEHKNVRDRYEALIYDDDMNRVVISIATGEISNDFLVTLRNAIGVKPYHDHSILFVFKGELDSLERGAKSMEGDGMPLNIQSVRSQLDWMIEQRIVESHHKEILKIMLEKSVDNYSTTNSSIFDLEHYLSIIQRGRMDDADFRHFGLFPYSVMDGEYNKKTLRDEIKQNGNWFSRVMMAHSIGDKTFVLDNFIGDVRSLLSNPVAWPEVKYMELKKSYAKAQQKQKIEYRSDAGEQKTDEGLVMWNRPEKETAAGIRNRHIVIFDPDDSKEIRFSLRFNVSLNKDNLKPGNLVTSVVGQRIDIVIGYDSKSRNHMVKYDHEKKSSTVFTFNIVVLPISSDALKSHISNFSVPKSDEARVVVRVDEELCVGVGPRCEYGIDEYDGAVVAVNDSESIVFSYGESTQNCSIRFNRNNRLFVIESSIASGQSVQSIDEADVFTKKISLQEDFQIDESTLRIGVYSYQMRGQRIKAQIEDERRWVLQGTEHQVEMGGLFKDKQLRLPERIRSLYHSIVNEYRDKETVPLLSVLNPHLMSLLDDYIGEFVGAICRIEANSILPDDLKDLFRLGARYGEQEISLTPFHIINLIHQRALQGQYLGNDFPKRFLSILNPNAIVPLVMIDNAVFKARNDIERPGWIHYDIYETGGIDNTAYTRRIVRDKIAQYINHFEYLFKYRTNPSLTVNVVNVNDFDNVALGIMDFIVGMIDSNRYEEIPFIDVNGYDQDNTSVLRRMNWILDIDELERSIGYDFDTSSVDKRDVIRIVRERIRYHINHDVVIRPAHITFAQMRSVVTNAEFMTNDLDCGVRIGGLQSFLTLTGDGSNYRIGYGERLLKTENETIKLFGAINEYVVNAKNDFNSAYRKDVSQTLVVTDTYDYEELFASSDWVVLISPDVGLDFFSNKFQDLLVIHYSDQYTSNSYYDAITLTKKTDKYKTILAKNIKEMGEQLAPNGIDRLIDSFNAVNGEWLLKTIGDRSNFTKEKFSILSAFKHLLAFFRRDGYLWIPISMEEILRVSGAAGLSGAGGVFSVKELDKHGQKSDDILMIGLYKPTNEKTRMVFIPAEVKVGQNKPSVIGKAKEQLKSSNDTLMEFLLSDDDEKALSTAVFRSFFFNLAITSLGRLKTFGVLSDTDGDFEKYLEDVINGNFEVDVFQRGLNGIIVSFKDDCASPQIMEDDGFIHMELNSRLSFKGLTTDLQQIVDDYVSMGLGNPYDMEFVENVQKEGNAQGESFGKAECDGTEDFEEESDEVLDEDTESEIDYDIESEIENPTSDESMMIGLGDSEGGKTSCNSELGVILGQSIAEGDITKVRFLLGQDTRSNSDLHWEFGHPQLSNRHLLITGASGSGKTYAIQTLLYEASKRRIPVVVFDYTEGFSEAHLHEDFVRMVGESVEHHIVYSERIGINPFARFPMQIGGKEMFEDEIKVAQRMASTFSNVYKFKEQQYSAIYDCTKRGLKETGDAFTLTDLVTYLSQSDNPAAKTVISKIQPFADSELFISDNKLDWGQIRESGAIHIFQFAGYDRQIQTITTELMLWDIWNYMSKNGSEQKPMVLVLDEAQNISHGENSPSGKILTEGRKFGISGWYATQFLKSAVNDDEIQRLQQAAQKLYFKPADSGLDEISRYIATGKDEIQLWQGRLRNLRKGEAVSIGSKASAVGLTNYQPTVVSVTPLAKRR